MAGNSSGVASGDAADSGAGVTTRLDRLFNLLGCGSNSLTRRTAAEQIGQVQRYHSHELLQLLFRTRNYLISDSWETRTAAGQAVEAIAAQTTPFQCLIDPIATNNDESHQDIEFLSFEDFDVTGIIERGQPLLASAGGEFDDVDWSKFEPKKRIEIQRKRLLKRLGFNKNIDCGLDELIQDADFETVQTLQVKQEIKQQANELIGKKLSARERNRLKRLQKAQTKSQRTVVTTQNTSSSSASLHSEVGKQKQTQESSVVMMDQLQTSIQGEECKHWPFQPFCCQLMHDMLDLKWEIRHGAGIGLRSILQLHGDTFGLPDLVHSVCERHRIHTQFIDDCAIRILCVFALDTFADYSSGQAVCPVRETMAQVLGVLLQHASPDSVRKTCSVLTQLSIRSEWERRHSGYLGFKYVLAVRQDLVSELLPTIIPLMTQGLADTSDDVRSVIAESLLPIIQQIAALSLEALTPLLAALWDTITEYDDLSVSVSSVMGVISSYYSLPNAPSPKHPSAYIQRVWPCLSHSSAVVRCSSYRTLSAILNGENKIIDEWLPAISCDFLRIVFQCLLGEEHENVLNSAMNTWQLLVSKCSSAFLADDCDDKKFVCVFTQLLALASTLESSKFNEDLMMTMNHSDKLDDEKPLAKKRKLQDTDTMHDAWSGKFSSRGSPAVWQRGARALGFLATHLGLTTSLRMLDATLRVTTNVTSPTCACLVVSEIFHSIHTTVNTNDDNVSQLATTLTTLITTNADTLGVCVELKCLHDELNIQCKRLIKELQQQTLPNGDFADFSKITFPVSTAIAYKLATDVFDSTGASTAFASNLRDRVLVIIHDTSKMTRLYLDRLNASAAEASIYAKILPPKLNPIIKALRRCISKKSQVSCVFRHRSATAIGTLVHLCAERKSPVNAKILEMLVALFVLKPDEIMMNSNTNTVGSRVSERESAEMALAVVLRLFGDTVFHRIPLLWSVTSHKLLSLFGNNMDSVLKRSSLSIDDSPDELISEMQMVCLMLNHANNVARAQLSQLLVGIFSCIKHTHEIVRHQASISCKEFCRVETVSSVEKIVQIIVPMLSEIDDNNARIGASTVLRLIVQEIGVKIGAYLAFLVVPILARMSDAIETVRQNASLTFAHIVRLMPLESGIENPPNMNSAMAKERAEKRLVLAQLLDGSKIANHTVTDGIKAQLRSYQQDGVNWLSFLQKFSLHGVLCDDMGLGKTLQTICAVATNISHRRTMFKEKTKPQFKPLPSLVICPSTLVHHWKYEIEKFCDAHILRGFTYSGTMSERNKIRNQIIQSVGDNIVIMSYQVLRSDIKHFLHIHWNWCILDEGHIIKNASSQISKVVKQVQAHHRLVLSGTPIQNNVLDLWSLFDFLMPGYLGNQQYFQKTFSKVISAGNAAKACEQDQANATLALEALHRQMLPFLLRRLKEDVLSDLPPKIIQDYFVELSPLQLMLYDSFAKSGFKKEVDSTIVDGDKFNSENMQSMHVFQSLQYLRKLCSHPALVLDKSHPDYEEVNTRLKNRNESLHDLHQAPKFVALKQLLLDCGIGVTKAKIDSSTNVIDAVGQHRVLVFAQLKTVLDLIETDLFKPQMPSLTYRRLDGNVSSAARFDIVRKFNEDPTIDVLLMTTHVGGLGLNLTGADTVIFIEHDWNPSKDRQAMDRAHRIGQKKVVNVYRLITRGTLEEKIMSLQKFKQDVADTVVTTDNASMHTMDTGNVLDLLTVSSDRESETSRATAQVNQSDSVDAFGNTISAGSKAKKGSARAMIESLQTLWDESQYDEEYNMKTFISKLKPK